MHTSVSRVDNSESHMIAINKKHSLVDIHKMQLSLTNR